MPRRLAYANLSDKEMERVHKLEEQMGNLILVLEPRVDLADLTDEQVEEVRALEEELGVVLIAYKPGQE